MDYILFLFIIYFIGYAIWNFPKPDFLSILSVRNPPNEVVNQEEVSATNEIASKLSQVRKLLPKRIKKNKTEQNETQIPYKKESTPKSAHDFITQRKRTPSKQSSGSAGSSRRCSVSKSDDYYLDTKPIFSNRKPSEPKKEIRTPSKTPNTTKKKCTPDSKPRSKSLAESFGQVFHVYSKKKMGPSKIASHIETNTQCSLPQIQEEEIKDENGEVKESLSIYEVTGQSASKAATLKCPVTDSSLLKESTPQKVPSIDPTRNMVDSSMATPIERVPIAPTLSTERAPVALSFEDLLPPTDYFMPDVDDESDCSEGSIPSIKNEFLSSENESRFGPETIFEERNVTGRHTGLYPMDRAESGSESTALVEADVHESRINPLISYESTLPNALLGNSGGKNSWVTVEDTSRKTKPSRAQKELINELLEDRPQGKSGWQLAKMCLKPKGKKMYKESESRREDIVSDESLIRRFYNIDGAM